MRGVAAAAGWTLALMLLGACGGAQRPQASKSPGGGAGVATEAGGDADEGEGDTPDAAEGSDAAPPPQQGPMVTSPTVNSGQKLSSIEEAEEALQASVSALDKLFSGDGSTELSGGDGCNRACSAFRSLQRSADALCEMAGEDDARCTSARSKVSDNQSRIANAGCSCP